MNILPTTPQTTPTSGTAKGPAPASDFETFLRMLTVQIQNQDPLSPMKSEDFAVQLATFSGVEQQVRTNDLLSAMQGGGMAGVAAFSDWIGREVRIEGSAELGKGALQMEATVPPATTRSVLVVEREGQEVTRIDLGAEAERFTFTGRDAAGNALLAGRYELRLEHFNGDALVGQGVPAHYKTITELRSEGGSTILLASDGSRLAPGDVAGLRQSG